LPTATGKRDLVDKQVLGALASAINGRLPTEHLKQIPRPRALRERLRRRAATSVERLDRTRRLDRQEFESLARRVVSELGLPECFVGWTMVTVASAFWEPRVASVAPAQRLLLLPAILGDGLDSDAARAQSSASAITSLRARAKDLGYQVLWAEDSLAILAALESGDVEALVGVASLDVLEKALGQILLLDLPCLAIPSWQSESDNRSAAGAICLDVDWVREMIELPYSISTPPTPNYIHLIRAAKRMFEPEDLERLAPRLHTKPRAAEQNGHTSPTNGAQATGAQATHGFACGAKHPDPIAGTEEIAFEFLAKGGKHSRPFITLAVYDALTGGRCAQPGGKRYADSLPRSVQRAALSIETFHKASLVHDDIEDDDQYRYGDRTLHRKFGVATAINVGDYLIGLGYRLVSRERAALGAETVGEILDRLAEAHMKLTEGQGAELLWRDSHAKRLMPDEALEIYALKTAPAFEAALMTGLQLAGPADRYVKPIGEFARYLGIAFQILNDLADWQPDNHNKLVAAGDVSGGRPTVLWALAMEGLGAGDRARLESLSATSPPTETTVRQIRRLYHQSQVFDKAAALVKQYESRVRAVADELQPLELRRLLHFLCDMVLKRPPPAPPND
jgi:geranylgeranyl pyrophosphate synthase